MASRRKAIDQQARELGVVLVNGVRAQPNKLGRTAATLEWAKRLTPEDGKLLVGQAAYGVALPDPDEGFTEADMKNPRRGEAIERVVRRRIERFLRENPGGVLVREAPAAEVKKLHVLQEHLRPGRFLTKFRKAFTAEEMNEDPVVGPARYGDVEDVSEYTERLPAAPP
jgi:hypothetical protein